MEAKACFFGAGQPPPNAAPPLGGSLDAGGPVPTFSCREYCPNPLHGASTCQTPLPRLGEGTPSHALWPFGTVSSELERTPPPPVSCRALSRFKLDLAQQPLFSAPNGKGQGKKLHSKMPFWALGE